MSKKININDNTKLEIESIVLQRLISHLQKRTDVQNIDLMNLSGFCRNCLSNWYQEAANDLGISFSKNQAKKQYMVCLMSFGKKNIKKRQPQIN